MKNKDLSTNHEICMPNDTYIKYSPYKYVYFPEGRPHMHMTERNLHCYVNGPNEEPYYYKEVVMYVKIENIELFMSGVDRRGCLHTVTYLRYSDAQYTDLMYGLEEINPCTNLLDPDAVFTKVDIRAKANVRLAYLLLKDHKYDTRIDILRSNNPMPALK